MLEQNTPPQQDSGVIEQHIVTSRNKVRGRKQLKRTEQKHIEPLIN